MKSIMYHYVHEYLPERPWHRFLHIDDFRRQLDHFENEGRLMTRADFDALLAGELPRDHSVLLTFDDGLACHATYVLEELNRRGAVGLFFVSTLPYISQQMLNVHRIHLLLGQFGGKAMWEALQPILNDQALVHANNSAFHEKIYRQQTNDDDTYRLKQALNFFADSTIQTQLLDQLIAGRLDEASARQSYYLSHQQLAELADAGMIIGGHSVSHPVLSKLSRDEQAEEIGQNLAFLKDLLRGTAITTFCYPHGGFHTFNQDSLDLLTEDGVKLAFNVEPRATVAEDLATAQRRLMLPRFDCNRFPYGQVFNAQVSNG